MTDRKPYRHRFPLSIIQHALWLYHRFALSERDPQEAQLILDRLAQQAVTQHTALDWRWLNAAGIGPLDLPLRLCPGVRCWSDLGPEAWHQLQPYDEHLVTFRPQTSGEDVLIAPLLSVADWLGEPLLRRYGRTDPQLWLDGWQ